MIKNFFTVAVRNLLRNRLLSFVNIAGLAIGLTCVILITLFVKDEWSFDRFYPNGKNIYRFVQTQTDTSGSERRMANSGLPQGPVFAAEAPGIENYCRIKGWDMNVKKGSGAFSSLIIFADPSVFSIFSLNVLKGNSKKMLDGRNSVVLSESQAEKYFGNEDPVGKTVEIEVDENFEPFMVTGIVKDMPANSSLQFDMLIPMERQNPTNAEELTAEMNNWGNGYLNTFFLLRKGADPKAVEKSLWNVYLAHNGEGWKHKQENGAASLKFGLQPLSDIHLNTDFNASNGLSSHSDSTYSYILSALAVLILIIACINFINIALARSMQRSKEIGIRKVSGSSRRQVVYQFLGEALFITIIAFAVSLLLVQLLLPFFNNVSHKQFSISYLLQPQAIAIFAGLIIVITFLAGFYPAFVASGFKPAQTLYSRFKLSGKNVLGRSLIVVQFVIASALIIGTIVFNRQFEYISHADLGYNADNMFYLQFPWNKTSQLSEFKNELSSVPAIQSSGTKSGNWNKTMFVVNGKQTDWLYYENIDDNYLQVLHIPLKEGRYLSYANVADTVSNCMVNEAFADMYLDKSKSPLGQQISGRGNDVPYTVVGVVKNYHSANFKEKIQPIFFSLDTRGDLLNTYIKYVPGKEEEARAAIVKAYKKILPYSTVELYDMKQWLMDKYEEDAQWKKIISFSAIIAIAISLLGLLALTVFSVQQRVKEIGIRKVLGASVANITFILSKQFLILVLLALIIASPVAWWVMNKWLADFAYRTDIAWWIFPLAGMMVLITAFATVAVLASKAAKANPVKSLRME